MLLAAGADAVHPWQAIAVARDLAGSRGNEDARPRRGRGEPARRAGARHAQGAGPDGDQHPRLVPRRPALRRRRSRRRGRRPLLPRSAPDGRDRHPGAARRGGARPSRSRLRGGARPAPAPALVDPGFARFRADGELHAFAPAVVKATQALAAGHPAGVGPGAALAPAVADDAVEDQLAAYRAAVARDEPAMVRDLLALRRARPVPLAAVEPAAEIVRRFVSSAMSLGALSPEAHRRPRDRDASPRRRVELRRGRRGSRRLRARRERRAGGVGDQAGRVGPLRRDGPLPRPGRAARDQDGPGEQARRGRPAPGEEGDAPDRGPPSRPGRHDLHQPAAPPRHLLDRGPGPAHRRPAGGQPGRPDRGEARRHGRRRDDRRRRGQGPRGLRPGLRPRGRHRRQPALVDQVGRGAVGARPRRGPPGPRPPGPARPRRPAHRRRAADRS